MCIYTKCILKIVSPNFEKILYTLLQARNKSSNSHGKGQRELLHKKDSYLRTKILVLGSEKTFQRVTCGVFYGTVVKHGP